jgi:hypothetical protein
VDNLHVVGNRVVGSSYLDIEYEMPVFLGFSLHHSMC